jgi:hypothetical protein
MSSFSKQEDNNKLPTIGKGLGDEKEELVPTEGSPLRRSFSPGKTFNKTGTMTNFYFKQDKEKMDAAAERLIHSVNAVTDLLKANTKLREKIEKIQRDLEEKDAEGFQLQIENQALRERLELVEGILKNNN